MGKLIDLTGQRFGRLVVVEKAGRSKEGSVTWLCRCDCGGYSTVTTGHLRGGNSTSCGCRRTDTRRERYKAIQKQKSIPMWKAEPRLYSVWCQMKNRCTNQSNRNYKNYGARGVTVCDEWMGDFGSFLVWARSSGYREGLWLERIDNSKGYSPDNCRWATAKEQGRNKRNNRLLTFRGETHSVAEWAEIVGISRNIIGNRLRAGWSIERVLTEPVKKTK